MVKRLLAVLVAAVGVLAVAAGSGATPGDAKGNEQKLRGIKHIVVIYEENHSFDNLYGGWEGVRGLADADALPAAVQVVEAVVLLVDDDDVLDVAELVLVAVRMTRCGARTGGHGQDSHGSHKNRQ